MISVTCKFTTNQAILLLDISRGFDASNHTGAVISDLHHLQKMRYIQRNVEFSCLKREAWSLALRGRAEVDRIVMKVETKS